MDSRASTWRVAGSGLLSSSTCAHVRCKLALQPGYRALWHPLCPLNPAVWAEMAARPGFGGCRMCCGSRPAAKVRQDGETHMTTLHDRSGFADSTAAPDAP